MLYRITINGKGIYSVLKESMSQKEWHNFKKVTSDWLPNPGEELYKSNDCLTYFTEEGYKKFMELVAPTIKWLFPSAYVQGVPDTNKNLLYADKYQKVFKVGG